MATSRGQLLHSFPHWRVAQLPTDNARGTFLALSPCSQLRSMRSSCMQKTVNLCESYMDCWQACPFDGGCSAFGSFPSVAPGCAPATAESGYALCGPQEDSTSKRMQLQRDLLTGSVSYMRARVALEGAFSAPEAVKDAGAHVAIPMTLP